MFAGNPLTAQFLSEPCYNLIYLEIAACRLTALPPNIATLVPNLRVLNLNYNFLEDVKPLEGLRRLNKLTIIGSRLKGTNGIIKVLRGCPDVEMVDFRYVISFCASGVSVRFALHYYQGFSIGLWILDQTNPCVCLCMPRDQLPSPRAITYEGVPIP